MEIKDKSSVIFGNQIDEKTIKSANKSKAKYIKMFGSLINMVLPVRVNSSGALISTIAWVKGIDSGVQNNTVSGSVLNNQALVLNLEWSGSGLNDKVRVMGDYGSRMYLINEVKNG